MELEDVSFQFLQEITDGFSEERILGEGAFGVGQGKIWDV